MIAMNNTSGSRVKAILSGPNQRTRILVAVVMFCCVLLAFVIAGTAGVFSTADRQIRGELADPSKQLPAAVALTDQLETEIASAHPSLPGLESQLHCPAAWAASASRLVSGLTLTEADAALKAASVRFHAAGWKVISRTSLGVKTVEARRGRELLVTAREQAGDPFSTFELTVTIPCPTARAKHQKNAANSATVTPSILTVGS